MPADPALVEQVRARLAAEHADPTPARVAAAVRAQGRVLGDAELLALLGTLRFEITGAGPLQPLLADDDVTDVLVNAPNEVWVDRGAGPVRAPVTFVDEQAVRRLASGSRPPRDVASMTRRRTSTPGCPTARGCMRCCRLSLPAAPASRCECRAGAPSP